MKHVHWGRTILYGFLAELMVIVVLLPFGLLGRKVTIYAVPVASFGMMVVAAFWISRYVKTPVLHGVLIALVAIAFYQVIPLIINLLLRQVLGPPRVTPNLTPEAIELDRLKGWLYPLSHVFKILGGALGGVIAGKRATIREQKFSL